MTRQAKTETATELAPSSRPGRRPRVVVLTGPTAVGKTAVAVEVAERLGAEIINADSRAVYEEVNIGVAKPGPDELARVPHHLLSYVPLSQRYSAVTWAREAAAVAARLEAAGRLPLIVGGSGFFIKTLIIEVLFAPPVSAEGERRLWEPPRRQGAQALHEELRRRDPAAAARCPPNNVKRLVRYLGVLIETGQPISWWWSRAPGRLADAAVVVICFRPRDELYRRIDERVEEMVRQGLVDEALELIRRHGRAPGLLTHGYQEFFPVAEGTGSVREAIEAVKRNTRRYAKRQLTFFRRQMCCDWPVVWVQLAGDIDQAAGDVASVIRAFYGQPPPHQARS